MNLDYVPLLRVMRELQSIPREQPPDFNGVSEFNVSSAGPAAELCRSADGDEHGRRDAWLS